MKKKNFSLILLLIFLISSVSIFAERVINQDKLIRDENSNIVYVEGEDKPFTGTSKSYYESGNIETEISYTNGKIDGLFKSYYENGNINMIANFIDDKLDGDIEIYKEDGTLDFIAPYKNGEPLTDKQVKILEYPDENDKEKDDIVVDTDSSDYTTKNTFFSLYGSYVINGIIVLVILISILKIYKAFPQTKNLSDEDRNRIFNILMKYRGEHENLHSSYRLNGFGTGFYRVRSMMVDEEKIIIYAKMISLLFIPVPIILGYLVCYRKDKILGSFSNAEFEEAKKEIREKVLYM